MPDNRRRPPGSLLAAFEHCPGQHFQNFTGDFDRRFRDTKPQGKPRFSFGHRQRPETIPFFVLARVRGLPRTGRGRDRAHVSESGSVTPNSSRVP